MNFSLIVATDKNNGIGYYDGSKYCIPWYNKEDLQFFKSKTTEFEKTALIVGRNTFLTLPKIIYSTRHLLVLTSKPELIVKHPNVKTFSSFDDALNSCVGNYNKVFVIGGSYLYGEALNHHKLEKVYWNIILNTTKECNIFFPKCDLQLIESHLNEDHTIKYQTFKPKYYENNYINLLKDILQNGDLRQTRNAKTLSLFGKHLEFNLKNEFPLLTTKKMFLRGIFEELIWFLKGETDSKILEDKRVNIWKWNTTKEFIQERGLNYKEGDIGNMYGFQWRHNGTEYNGCDKDYAGKGFDQIEYCLNLLRTDKYSRRILMTTYSPYNASKGVLYPCHGLTVQWYVREDRGINYLSCHMYQRSADMFLGVPFNISSYSLLTYMFCEVLNNKYNLYYKPDKLIISFGDVHIYDTHLEQVREQIARIPYRFPTIEFTRKIDNLINFKWEDVKINNYVSHKRIKANMVA